MTKVIFVDSNDNRHTIDAKDGDNLMQVAISHNLPGIDGDCGGSAACGTCHVRIAPEWRLLVGELSGIARDLLDFSGKLCEASYLACQIQVDPSIDGLEIQLSREQS